MPQGVFLGILVVATMGLAINPYGAIIYGVAMSFYAPTDFQEFWDLSFVWVALVLGVTLYIKGRSGGNF